jgi:hypothetical protein
MAVTINADTLTGSAVVTADNSGVLALQAAGVTKLTVASSGVTLASALPIASGGTNTTTTPTAGAIPYGTGTAYAFSSAGTSGQVLTSAGSSAPTGSNVFKGFSAMQFFLVSGTFTIPAGKTTVKVTVVGAGGGAGSASGSNSGPGGGGGGGAGISYLTSLTPGNTISVTVGTGGAGGVGSASGFNATDGTTGGSSSIQSGTQSIATITATGGEFGIVSTQGGAGGTCSGANLNIAGSGGSCSGGGGAPGGIGGSSILGGGGRAQSSTGVNGGNYGGGGSGAGGATAQNGGTGANGVVIFEY